MNSPTLNFIAVGHNYRHMKVQTMKGIKQGRL